MKKAISPIVLTLLFFCNGCSKQNNVVSSSDCFGDAVTVRVINNQPATVKLLNGVFYLVENNTIDSKLKPCNLPAELQVNNLQIKISGDVKAIATTSFEPCCTYGFVISQDGWY